MTSKGVKALTQATSPNLDHVTCKLCKARTTTYRKMGAHFLAAHPKIKHPHPKEHYVAVYKNKPRTKTPTDNKTKAPPTTKPKQTPALHGMTELVIPVLIRIPIMLGQPTVVEPE